MGTADAIEMLILRRLRELESVTKGDIDRIAALRNLQHWCQLVEGVLQTLITVETNQRVHIEPIK